jgi:hypothetical protein
MNQEFVASEIKYSMVYEDTVKNIRNTPFWDDTYLSSTPYQYNNKTSESNNSPSKEEV